MTGISGVGSPVPAGVTPSPSRPATDVRARGFDEVFERLREAKPTARSAPTPAPDLRAGAGPIGQVFAGGSQAARMLALKAAAALPTTDDQVRAVASIPAGRSAAGVAGAALAGPADITREMLAAARGGSARGVASVAATGGVDPTRNIYPVPEYSNGPGPGRLVDLPGYDYPILELGSGGRPVSGSGVWSWTNRDVLPAGNVVPPGTPLDQIAAGTRIVYPSTSTDHTGEPSGSVFVRLQAPIALKQFTGFHNWTVGDAFAAAVARHGGFYDHTDGARIADHVTTTSGWAWSASTIP